MLLSCSNILFREFALISMWRVPAMPIGAHTLLGFLAEPLKQLSEIDHMFENYNVSENLREFQDWVCYFLCSPLCFTVWYCFKFRPYVLIYFLLVRVNTTLVMQHIVNGLRLTWKMLKFHRVNSQWKRRT